MHAKTDVDEYFPEEVVGEVLPLLLFDCMTQVTMLTVLHNDTDGLLCDERVVVAYHEVAVDLSHDGYLFHRFQGCVLRQNAHVNFLNNVGLVSDQLSCSIRLFYGTVHVNAESLFFLAIFFEELRTVQLDTPVMLDRENRRFECLDFVDDAVCSFADCALLLKHAPIYIKQRHIRIFLFLN